MKKVFVFLWKFLDENIKHCSTQWLHVQPLNFFDFETYMYLENKKFLICRKIESSSGTLPHDQGESVADCPQTVASRVCKLFMEVEHLTVEHFQE